jgi:hypothetical protein
VRAGPGRQRSVRVLVAEAASPAVPLASILEAAGHRVVGRASTADELERLLRVTRPTVVVFDAEMSVEAVVATRSSFPSVGIVAVWPPGVASEAVDRVVRPESLGTALPVAVRSAAPALAKTRGRPAPAIHRGPAAAAPAAPGRRRGGVELAVAAVLTFLLLVSAVALRIGEEGGGTLAGRPGGGNGQPSPVGTRSPVTPPPDGPAAGSTDPASLLTNETRLAPPGGGSGVTPGTGEGVEPTPNAPGNPAGNGNPDRNGNGGGTTITARERACRQAAGLPRAGAINEASPRGNALRHVFERCVATDSPGPLRALERLAAGGNGAGSGHGHAYGHDADHHGHAYGHDADHHGHAYGHDADHHGNGTDHGTDHGNGNGSGHDADHRGPDENNGDDHGDDHGDDDGDADDDATDHGHGH